MKRSPIKRRRRRGGQMPHDVYETVMLRSRGRCEARLPGVCTGKAEEWHHRQRRQRNNDTVANGAALCHACHHYITHVSPKLGRGFGLIVHSHHPNPAEVAMKVGRDWVFLTEDGGYKKVNL